MAKLELTDERRQIIRKATDEWLAVGLSTEPADFDAAEAAVTALYEGAGLKRPYFVRLSSPFAAELYINLLLKTWPEMKDQLRDQLGGQLRDQLRAQLWGQLRAQLGDQLRAQLGDQLWAQLRDGKLRYTGTWAWGSWDAYWWGFYDGGRRVGARYPKKLETALDAHCAIVRSCGWVYPFQDFCIVTDRPETIRREDDGRLHCEDGPALLYRDGYSLYAFHGTRIPAEWITDPSSLTPEIALTHENVEMRRAACEILGWDAVLTKLGCRSVQKDDDPEIGELVEVDIPEIGRERFLRVRCGTGRAFALPVPPNVSTALEANAWTYGIEPNLLQQKEHRT